MAVQSGVLVLLLMWKPKNVAQKVGKLKGSQAQTSNFTSSNASASKA
jgi:hypothetical protein